MDGPSSTELFLGKFVSRSLPDLGCFRYRRPLARSVFENVSLFGEIAKGDPYFAYVRLRLDVDAYLFGRLRGVSRAQDGEDQVSEFFGRHRF